MGVFREIPVGVKYNKLTVVKEVDSGKHPNGRTKRYVEVKCDCGLTVVKPYSDVKHGGIKSCGNCERENTTRIDLVGLVVNRLTVTNFSRKSGNRLYWNCKCDCGNTIEAEGVRLRNGRIHNCGICGTKLGAYYLGDKVTNNEGQTAEIVKINGRILGLVFPKNKNIVVDIEYNNVGTGGFSNPFARSVFNEGYFGVGKFIAKYNGVHTAEYEDWHSMIRRCYDNSAYHVTYQDVEVYESWKCYQTFAEWATKQVGFNNKGWHLDKDLLIKGSRIYSPDTCTYLPREINGFIKRKRMNDLPLGVDLVINESGVIQYRSQGRANGSNVGLGSYPDIETAFNVYKKHKEALAKDLAVTWKSKIDKRAYEALMNYTVDITD